MASALGTSIGSDWSIDTISGAVVLGKRGRVPGTVPEVQYRAPSTPSRVAKILWSMNHGRFAGTRRSSPAK